MTYLCPVCRQNSLTVIAKMDLAEEGRSGDSSAQLLLCGHCGLHAVGINEPIGEESPSFLGYIVDKGTWSELHLSWAGAAGPPPSLLMRQNLDRLSSDELRAFAMVSATTAT